MFQALPELFPNLSVPLECVLPLVKVSHFGAGVVEASLVNVAGISTIHILELLPDHPAKYLLPSV